MRLHQNWPGSLSRLCVATALLTLPSVTQSSLAQDAPASGDPFKVDRSKVDAASTNPFSANADRSDSDHTTIDAPLVANPFSPGLVAPGLVAVGTNETESSTGSVTTGGPLMRGGGNLGNLPSFESLKNVPKPGITWTNPSPLPSWIHSASTSTQQRAKTRFALQTEINVDLNAVPLRVAIESIAEKCKIQAYINVPELDLLGVDIDTPITMSIEKGSAADLLALILDPLDLAYSTRSIGLEITTKDAVDADPVVAYYDLAWVIDRSDDAKAVLDAIEQTIHPDSWISNGGTSTLQCVGRVLVVAAPDSTQSHIESFFANLARFRTANTPASVDTPAPGAKPLTPGVIE